MFILIAILVLSFLIFIHELGHFTVAKLSGIPVDEFSLGFGPAIFSRQWGETRYSLRVLPLGGYNKIAGMEPNDDRPDGFDKKPLAIRMGVIIAGSLSNFLAAVLLFILVFSLLGNQVAVNQIGDVVPNMPADQIGLKAGDRIVQIDGARTADWDEVSSAIRSKGQRQITVTVERGGSRRDFLVTPVFNPDQKLSQIGISPVIELERLGFLPAVKTGLVNAIEFAHLIIQSLVQLVTGEVSIQNMSGPVGIVLVIGDSAREGMRYLLMLTGILGINLAIVNLLPIPALDGSRLVFLLIEGLRGRPINPEKENIIHLAGFALLMCLVVLVTYNDIVRLLSGG